ncbi:hypothetical protein INH39_05690 [Massilia violaceinigra]|uniref:Uncharacterized protein n=1 Tax=Massilia violaceinigra TaxID=2045208 RepID=A0ABY4AB74_9BURK|nr:hypothetical protein [Massilia violaceinigra]UOD31209.1 hypothetical protein INH39_05690 [Massilia violaceinigra]
MQVCRAVLINGRSAHLAPNIPGKRLIIDIIIDTFSNLERRYRLSERFSIPFWIEENVAASDGAFALVDGTLTWPRDLRLDWEYLHELAPDNKLSLNGLFVMGDLVVEGGVLNADHDSGPALFVRGNLVAHNVVTGGGDIVVQRDATVRDIVYGDYNHGSMLVEGHLYAGLVWMFDHMFDIRGDIHAAHVFNDETAFPPHPDDEWEDDVVGTANLMLTTPIEDTDDFHRQMGKGRVLLLPALRNTRTLAPAVFPDTAEEFLRFAGERDIINSTMIPPALRDDRAFMLVLAGSHPMGYNCAGNGWHLDPEFLQAASAVGNKYALERIARATRDDD